ncbi:hypothetical protein ONZ45_g14742 [Pleurotus djamor]|nr:hypothetical protein ONZ45_g14742 [Pleurotus djamor]
MSTSFPRDGGDGEVWHAEESDRIHARRLARSTAYEYGWLSALRFVMECNLCELANSEWSYDHGSGLHAGEEGSASGGYGDIGGVELVTALKRLDLSRIGGERGLSGFSADELAPEIEVQRRGGARMGLGVECVRCLGGGILIS